MILDTKRLGEIWIALGHIILPTYADPENHYFPEEYGLRGPALSLGAPSTSENHGTEKSYCHSFTYSCKGHS